MTNPSEPSAELTVEQRAMLAVQRLKSDANGLQSQRIPVRAPSRAIPLSFAQQRLWFIHRLEPQSQAYNMVHGYHLTGRLDTPGLQQALQAIMARHEALRTTIAEGDEGPIQVIGTASEFALPITDLSRLPQGEREEEAHRLAALESARPFDLGKDLLLRAQLLRLAETEHLLLLTMHHIASDAWSIGILHRELAALYQAFLTRKVAPLPALPIQYADFSVWQRGRMESGGLKRQLTYWKGQLEGALPVLELPFDRPRPPVMSSKGADAEFALSDRLSLAVRDLSRKEGGTPFMTLLAGFQILLGRWSGQTDVVVGTAIAGRTHVDLEGLMGCFLNTLVMRTSLAGNPTFRELLGRVREVALEAYTNQELPFERLVEELQPERNPNHNPVFQTLFQVENTGRGELKLPGLEVTELPRNRRAAKFDLTVRIYDGGSGFSGVCSYSEDLFSHDTVVHLLEQYQLLLEQIVAAPAQPIQSYSLLTPRARRVIPDPATPLPKREYPLLTEAVARIVKEMPDRPAIQRGAQTWSYKELGAAVERLTHELRASGVGKGRVVAVTGPSSFGLVAGMLGVLAAEGVILPISADLPDRRKQLMLEQARASHLLMVGDSEARDAWTRSSSSIALISVDEHRGSLIGGGGVAVSLESEGANAPAGSDPAYIFFTSGTSGTPKGVLGIHQGIGHFLDWQRSTFGIGPGDRCAQLTHLSFDVILRDVFLPLWSGATLCLPPGEIPPDRVLAWLESEQINVVHVVPSLAHVWLEQAPPGFSLRALRWIFLAGEPLNDTLVRLWRRVVKPECGIVNLYGPTETTMVKCSYQVPSETLPGLQPVGKPLPETQALVISPDNRLCGVNEPGEIVLRTPFMTRGYVNTPEEQRRRFVPNPFFGDDQADLIYRTGDLGRFRTDGTLMVLGRLDQQIKIRGVRIEPEEVTAVLSRHPQVRACAVIGRELGDQPVALVGYVVAEQGEVDAGALRHFLAAQLPAPLVPSAFVFLDRLPLMPNGKLDHRGLPEPVPSTEEDETGPEAPRSPLEKALVEMWAEILRVPRVGIDDDFFALGGHSLLATRVVARLRTALGVELPLRTLFETPTVAGLAEVIAQRLSGNHHAPLGNGSGMRAAIVRGPE